MAIIIYQISFRYFWRYDKFFMNVDIMKLLNLTRSYEITPIVTIGVIKYNMCQKYGKMGPER